MEVSVKVLITKAVDTLSKHNVEDALIDSWLLAEYVLGINRTQYYINPEMTVPKKLSDKYLKLVELRATRVPLQHITGVQEFMGFNFKVNENVLIPRQETELLVEQVCEYIKQQPNKVKVLDMCTGSGCIAISIDQICSNAEVMAVDISKEALSIAEENNRHHSGNVTFIESDLFDNVEGKFDVIVSNPPYIKTAEIEKLEDEVRLHDPMIALDGDTDGLKFYRQIIKKANDYFEKNGMIFLEIGYDQGSSVPKLLDEYNYIDIKVLKDLSGNDRLVIGRRNKDV